MKYLLFLPFFAVALLSACDGGGFRCEAADCEEAGESGNGSDNQGESDNAGNNEGSGNGDGSDTSGENTNGNGDNSQTNNNDNQTPDNGGNSNTGDSNENSNGNEESPAGPPVASGLSLRHRHGQTFVTWDEPDADLRYHVYRSSVPITTENLSDATLLTWRWGALDSDTSRHKYAVTDIPEYFVIEDLGAPLADSTGLFVHTADENRTAYYAVTTIADNVENRTVIEAQNAASVEESVSTPQPVLVTSVNGGKGRLYTHYMDYQQWNPTLNGYAFSYFLALPFNYNPAQSYPLQVELHAYGYYPNLLEEVRYQWQVVQLIPLDPGDDLNTYHTWWYGHARDHNYLTDGNTPFDGAIENFTEQRVMKAIQETIDNAGININTDLIHAYGNSMGASGSVSLGLRYPDILSGIYASQPMMNYRDSTRFRFNFERLFGTTDQNLPVVNRGLYSENIQSYGEGGSQPTRVWDWMNHHEQVQRRSADTFAYLMLDFGKADEVIDWFTQGAPTFSAFSNARVAFTATAREGVGHEWRAFDSVNQNLFALETGNWNYPTLTSYPALNFASDSGRINPPSSGDDEYQTTLEWSTSHYGFGPPIVEQANRYEITLRSLTSVQQVDVTPRNTQLFRPAAGSLCNWSAQDLNSNTMQSGAVTADQDALVTVPQVSVAESSGTRLTLSCD